MLLDRIKDDNDLRELNIQQLDLLASEIRSFLVHSVSKTGGHLASNLGVVELTIALHRMFDLNGDDSVIWDVGHQCYTHKILSGRRNRFEKLRQLGGLSGFPKTEEDESDTFNTGHSSTSISAATGIAKGKELRGINGKTIAVIGDGAMTGGLAYEGLNHAGQKTKNLIVILNDNEMSISKNVGGMSKTLKRIRNANKYIKLKDDVKSALDSIPVVGSPTKKGLTRVKNDIKNIVVENNSFFESLGFKYLGPIDGHNFGELFTVLEHAKTYESPVFIHIHTKKGKGYSPAEKFPHIFHGVGTFNPVTGEVYKTKDALSWSDCFGKSLVELAAEDDRIAAVTAAMPHGTGLCEFAKRFPKRFFDVGIAEQHAVTFSAGLAKADIVPVFAVYSTFLQRGYDQILHDVALQNLHVVFAIDRSGPVGRDGETHQGVYDISYLSHMPNMTILSPSIDTDLKQMLEYSINKIDGPVAIRYPRGNVLTADEFTGFNIRPLDGIKPRILRLDDEKPRAVIISTGIMLKNAAEACRILSTNGIGTVLIDAVCLKPVDEDAIIKECAYAEAVAVVENNVDINGFGQQIQAVLGRKVIRFNYGDKPVQSGSVNELEKLFGLDPKAIADSIKTELNLGKKNWQD